MMKMDYDIRVYYSELKETPSKVISLEPFIIEKLLKMIQLERLREEEIVFLLCNQTGELAESIENKYEYWKNTKKREFNKLDFLQSICEKELQRKTKQLYQERIKTIEEPKDYNLELWLKSPELMDKVDFIIKYIIKKNKNYPNIMQLYYGIIDNIKDLLKPNNAKDRFKIASKYFNYDEMPEYDTNYSKYAKIFKSDYQEAEKAFTQNTQTN